MILVMILVATAEAAVFIVATVTEAISASTTAVVERLINKHLIEMSQNDLRYIVKCGNV